MSRRKQEQRKQLQDWNIRIMKEKIKVKAKYSQFLLQLRGKRWIDVNYYLYTRKINSVCREDGDQLSASPLIIKQNNAITWQQRCLCKILKTYLFASLHVSTYIDNCQLVQRCVYSLGTEGMAVHHDRWGCVLLVPNILLLRTQKFGSIL